MREILHAETPASSRPVVSLHAIVNEICQQLLPAARRSTTLLINQVAEELCIQWDVAVIRPVIAEVISSVIDNASRGMVFVTAERFRDTMYLQIQERNTQNGYALASTIKGLEPLALLLDGYISIKGEHALVTTISFTFPVAAPANNYSC